MEFVRCYKCGWLKQDYEQCPNCGSLPPIIEVSYSSNCSSNDSCRSGASADVK